MATPDFEGIERRCIAQRDERASSRYSKPLVRLWTASWEPHGVVRDYLGLVTTQKLNDVGSAVLEMRPTDPLAQWIMNRMDALTKRSVFLTIDKNGVRWSGRIKSYKISTDTNGESIAEFTALDDMEQLQHILCWPNPFLPATVQSPKFYTSLAPLKYSLKVLLFTNLFRLSGNLWNIPDNPLDPTTWLEGITPWNWPNVVMPGSVLKDNSPWGIISTRFEPFLEVAKPLCDEHGLMITYRRWLEGDPMPFIGAFKPRNGQCFWDIVDKGSVLGETALGGSIAGGLVRTVQEYAENMIDTTIGVVANPVNPPEYSANGSLLFTLKPAPYVIYRHNYGLQKSAYTREAAGAIQMVTGGHSAPGVNEAISMPIKLVGNVLGAIVPGLNTLGDLTDSVLKNIYEDVFLAFAAVKSPVRAAQAGWNPLEEQFLPAPGKSYTLSMALKLAEGFYQTREKNHHELDVGDGAPYVIGDRGEGHFGLGDRIGAEVPYRDGRVMVEQVQALSLSHKPGEAPAWKVTLGDPRTDDFPISRLFRDTGKLYNAIHNLGVI